MGEVYSVVLGLGLRMCSCAGHDSSGEVYRGHRVQCKEMLHRELRPLR
jgi:hypothetical protein